MPAAFRKEIYSSKLVLKAVVSGSRNVTKSLLTLQRKSLVLWRGFFFELKASPDCLCYYSCMPRTSHHHRARIHKKKKQPTDHLLINKLVLFMAIVEPLMTLPQIYEVWIRRETAGVSLMSWSFFFVAAIIWLLYGLKIKDTPLIVSSALWVLVEAVLIIGLLVF
jgi:MtN3 and saliva related transmembrane protein